MEFSLKLKENAKAEGKLEVDCTCRGGEACEKGEHQPTPGHDRTWSLVHKA